MQIKTDSKNHITIVVPVFNDSEWLQKFLDVISAQRRHLPETEGVVVDNASNISPKSPVGTFSFARYIYEKKLAHMLSGTKA